MITSSGSVITDIIPIWFSLSKMHTYHIDGKSIRDIDSMCLAFAKAVNAPNDYFGPGLPQFDDILFGGLGILEYPCEFVWHDSEIARTYLDCEMMVAHCELLISDAEWQMVSFENGNETIAQARNGKYSMFDSIVNMITSVNRRSHGRISLKLTLK